MSLKQLDQLFQQGFKAKFTEHADDWGSIDADEYDLSTITVPVKNIFVDGDTTCNNPRIYELMKTVPTVSYKATFIDDRDHASVVGANDNAAYHLFLSMLDPLGGIINESITCEADFLVAWTE